jgi:hypothetical protein
MGIRHPIAAYWLNEAVEWWGNEVEVMMSQTDPNTHKPLYVMNDILGIEQGVKVPKRKPSPPAPLP